MPFERIDRADDSRVAEYRSVRDAELVRGRGLFVAEGRLIVQRVIEDGRFTVRSVLVNEAARRSLDAVLQQIAPHVPILICAASEFLAIAGYNIHRGCLALVERPAPRSIDDLVAGARRIVVLDGVTDPDNVGSVFRNAAAFGADAVVLGPGGCDPLYRKAIRTSMAATLRVPFVRADSWPAALERLRSAGLRLVALTPREPAEELAAFAATHRQDRIALIVGTEGAGLSDAIAAAADVRVRIAMSQAFDSLNLAVAAGIALYELREDTAPG